MPAFLHTVHFWLKPELSDDQRDDFIAGVKQIANSPAVSKVRVGLPAPSDREVVDDSFDVQLVCEFDSSEAHDAYQSDEDEVHANFIKTYKNFWDKVLIYDSVRA